MRGGSKLLCVTLSRTLPQSSGQTCGSHGGTGGQGASAGLHAKTGNGN